MSLLKWSDNIATNIEEWDIQHKTIIEQLTSLYIINDDENHQNTVRQTYKLLYYLDVHFRYEEELMKQHKYSDYATHKSKHKSMSQKLLNLLILYSDDKKYIAAHIAPILNLWLEDHLESEDKKLSEYLNSKGIT